MRRRDFIRAVVGAAAAFPYTAGAQQSERTRRIGVLMSLAADDQEGQARFDTFVKALRELGWVDGRNVKIDVRWGAGAHRTRQYAAELVALSPDVILASGGSVVGALLQATRTVPIVFTATPDPIGAGFVDSLARPGGNATGFSNFDYNIAGKWLELIKQITPGGDARCSHSRPCDATGDRPVLGCQRRSVVAWVRCKPDKRKRTQRSRAQDHGFRSCSE